MSSVLISVHDVTKRYGNKCAVHGVSLDIYAGEIFGLLGANGAGKTTLLSLISSVHPATSGDICYRGVSIYEDLLVYRSVLGFCPQRPNFAGGLTVREYLEYAGRYFLMEKSAIAARVEELINRFDLAAYADKSPTVLSGGYKQRLLIARALVHRPQIVVLDEPTVALDPHVRRQLWDTIKELKADGVTILLTTHYIDEAEVLCDRVCVLDKGKVRLIDTPGRLMSSYEKSNLEDVFVQLMSEGTDEKA